ncbi:MAG: hypothetical protein Kow00124_18640 [Anaerolineae bacterium]
MPRRFTAALIGLALLAIAARLIPGPRIIDDAYITYRYAANLAAGHGLVYNPGEPVLGTTTPLYALLLVPAALLGGPAALPVVSPILNTLVDAANVVLLALLARRLLGENLPGLLAGMLWAVAPRSVTFAIGGMETALAVALMLAAFTLWLGGRSRPAAALTALATLTRPDALIWAGPLALGMIVERWRSTQGKPLARLPWAELGVYLAVVLPWVIYGTLTYGSPLPHSIAAKSAAYDLPPTHALTALVQQFSTPFVEFEAFGPGGAMAGSVIYAGLFAVGSLHLIRRDGRAAALVAYPALFWLAFGLANPLMFRWYTTPPLAVFMLALIGGVTAFTQALRSAPARHAVLGAAGALWLGMSLNAWTLHPDHGPDRPAPSMAWIALELQYERAARLLAPYVEPDTVIAAGDIGAVGWYSGARILDTLGLVSPQSTAYYPLPASMIAGMAYAVAPDLILEERPDYLIILEIYGRRGLLLDPRFEQSYRLIERIESDVYDSDGMLIYARRDMPAP